MKKRLNDDVLLPGDIALTTTNSFTSKTIRIATKSNVSHAMLYVTHCSIIHAVGNGVCSENTQRIFFEEDTSVHVMRLKGGVATDSSQQICDYVRSRVGSEYSIREALQTKIRKEGEFSAKQFCSRLIAQAYDSQGYRLVNNPNYCTPEDLFLSGLLIEIDGATRNISDQEVSFWQQNKGGSPEKTAAATNFILEEVRKIDPSVQTFDDLCRFVVQNPEYDEIVNQLHITSGYLDIWQLDYDEHHWRWNLSQMEQMTNQEGIEVYCLGTLKGEPRDNNRFTKSLGALQGHHLQWPRKTFATLIELHAKLAELHASRVDTAAQWLRKHTNT